MRYSEQLNEIGAAMAKAQGAMSHAKFDAVNPAFRSKYATLSAIVESIRPHLAANGIAWMQSIVTVEDGVYAITRLIHSSGQWLEMDGPVVPVDKRNAHGAGSATTYAKRFGLSAACGIAADADDDGNAAVQAAPEVSAPIMAPALRAKLKKTADYIIEAIGRDDELAVLEAWQELSEDEMAAIWKARTKDGFFTMEQKEFIRKAKHNAYESTKGAAA